MAGQPLTLTCSTSVQEGINGSLTLTWTKDDLEQPGEVRSGSLSLPFAQLHTSHGGVYICTARLIIPEAGVDISESNLTTITVQSMMYSLSFLSMILITSFQFPPRMSVFLFLLVHFLLEAQLLSL